MWYQTFKKYKPSTRISAVLNIVCICQTKREGKEAKGEEGRETYISVYKYCRFHYKIYKSSLVTKKGLSKQR